MNWLELFVRFVAGGSMVVLVTLLGRTSYPYLAGIAVLFPIITLTSFSFLIAQRGAEAVRPILLYSLISTPTFVIFIAVLYLALARFSPWLSMGLALLAWFVVAWAIFLADVYWFHLVNKSGG